MEMPLAQNNYLVSVQVMLAGEGPSPAQSSGQWPSDINRKGAFPVAGPRKRWWQESADDDRARDGNAADRSGSKRTINLYPYGGPASFPAPPILANRMEAADETIDSGNIGRLIVHF
jgi:hypothetical protein